MGWQCLKGLFLELCLSLFTSPSNIKSLNRPMEQRQAMSRTVVDQQHILEFYPSRNFPPVDVVEGTRILVHVDLLLTLMALFDSNKFFEINHMCHFSLSSNQTDSYLMCIKLALLNSCVLGRSLGCSRRLQPLVNVTNFGPCHCMPWRGIPDWLRDQFAVPKLPPEPVVRSGQRKVKVHWAMAASSSRFQIGQIQ